MVRRDRIFGDREARTVADTGEYSADAMDVLTRFGYGTRYRLSYKGTICA